MTAVTKSVRLVRPGDIIDVDDKPQVVFEVFVVVRFANGETKSIPASSTIDAVPKEDLSEIELQVLELDSGVDDSVVAP